MKRLIVILLLSLGITSPILAEVCTAVAQDANLASRLSDSRFSENVRTEFGVGISTNSVVLAYDHVYRKWTVYTVKVIDHTVTLIPYRVEPTLTGDTFGIELPSGSSALMFVTRTNPLLFKADAKPLTVTDSEDVETLKKFAALFGNMASGFVKIVGQRALTSGDEIRSQTERLAAAVAGLGRITGDIVVHHDQTIEFVQMAELGSEVTASIPLSDLAGDAGTAQMAFSDVRRKTSALSALLYPDCPELVTQARAAVTAYDAADYATLQGEIAGWQADMAAAETKVEQDANAAKIKAALEKIDAANIAVAKLKLPAKCLAPTLQLWADLQKQNDFGRITALADLVGGGSDLVAAAQAILAKEPATLKVAGWLGDVAATARIYSRSNDNNLTTCDFIDQPVPVRTGAFTPAAGKKDSGGFILSTTLDTKELYLKHPESLDQKVEITSTSKWGLGAGLIFTTDKLNSWTLVDDTSGKKVISHAHRDAFAGDIGLFANFHPGSWTFNNVSAGIQLGFATDAKKPAVFVGPSLDFGKWLRLGAGYAFHKNVKLAAGENEGQPPTTGAADVPTRDHYSGGFYLSLTLSLDGISIFKAE